MMKKPELLAPAGSLSCALAAFDAGADAVYGGLKRFNARERTENFSREEMAKLIAYAHKNGKKVYVTFNTLIKESELAEAAGEIAELDQLRPDALIVQDLGVLRILREYFPNLPIHGSTQMGLNNSAGLALAGKLGLSRVILERQTTIDELEEIMRTNPPVDVEVFIHGALCCCISGTCLFSSWQGGWSGNRGKCKQPCRRRYHSDQGNGFFLSAQDLCTLEILPRIIRTGVSSLKIEGRLRRADYAANVVSAYRMALDAENEEAFRAILPAARERLSHTCGRKWSFGYYTPESAHSLIKFDAMGVSGLLCGKVTGCSENGFQLSAMRRISIGDTIRIQPKSGDEGPSLRITKMTVRGKSTNSVSKDETAFIFADKDIPGGGMVYKISERSEDYTKRIEQLPAGKSPVDLHVSISRSAMHIRCGSLEWKKDLALEEAGSRPLDKEFIIREFRKMNSALFSFESVKVGITENPFLPASVFKTLRHEFLEWLEKNLPCNSAETESKKRLERFLHDYNALHAEPSRRDFRNCAILPRRMKADFPEKMRIAREIEDSPSPHEELLLPFFVNEPMIPEVRKAIDSFLAKGGRTIRISSLHHLAFLNDRKGISIITNMPLPVCNSMAAEELRSLGVSMIQGWLELEKKELEKLIEKSPLPVEIYCYGRPPLLSTRARIAAEKRMSDLRGEEFRIVRKGILTQILPGKVMEIPHVKGSAAYLYDFRHARQDEKETFRFNFDTALN